MKYYFYRTTNLINGKYYQGVHHSKDPEKDPYFGSGFGIVNAVKKYGRENFKVEVLKYFNSLDEAYEYEAKVITPESLNARVCYNQVPGGRGCKEGIIHMHKRNEEIRIHKNLQHHYELEGYIKGRSENVGKNISKVHKGKPSKQRGRVYLHKGLDEEIRVEPEKIQQYLEEGYELGHSELAKQRVRNGHIGRIVLNDGTRQVAVYERDVDKFLERGFIRGGLPKSEEQRKKISVTMTGKIESQETRERKKQAKLGRTWKIVDGKRVWSKRKDK